MSKPLRLYIIGIGWPTTTFIQRKLDGLSEAGIDVTVCVTRLPSRRERQQSKLSFLRMFTSDRREVVLSLLVLLWKILRYPRETRRAWQIIRDNADSSQQARKLFLHQISLIGETIDIIHFEWNSSAIQFLPVYDVYQAPVVISCRGTQVQITPHNPKRNGYAEKLRQSFERAAAVHCVSEAIKREAMLYGLDPSKATVIRPAVDPEYFVPGDPSHRNARPVILSVGTLYWRKGYEYAVHAIRLLVDQGYDVEYRIIGSWWEPQRILYAIDDLDLHDHVKLIKRIPPDEVLRQLQQADIFLLPSLSEGISNAVLEAMSCGVPVVTTDCGGMQEAIRDGQDGLIVSTWNAGAISKSIQNLLDNPGFRQLLATSARERILQKFTLYNQSQSWLNIYTNL